MPHPIKTILIYWFPILLYCILIFIQSAYPSPIKGVSIPHMDKLLHFGGYAFLGALIFRAIKNSISNAEIKTIMIISIVISSFYGLTDELHQSFVASRSADIMDFAADTAGSVFGVCIYYLVNTKITFYIQTKSRTSYR
ncbi:VanZ family protein [Desulfobacterales bacterium HSG17]|nr:VanZ family protein [Desulfobacterales bacterium HSG17]